MWSIALLAALLTTTVTACCKDYCDGAYVVSCEPIEGGREREFRTDCRAEGWSYNERFACAMVNGTPTCVLDGKPVPQCEKGAQSACDGEVLLHCEQGYALVTENCTRQPDTYGGLMGALYAEIRGRFGCAAVAQGEALCAYEGEPFPECSQADNGKTVCLGEEAEITCVDGFAAEVLPCATTKYPCKEGKCLDYSALLFCETDADCQSMSPTFTKCRPFVLGSFTTSFSLCATDDGK